MVSRKTILIISLGEGLVLCAHTQGEARGQPQTLIFACPESCPPCLRGLLLDLGLIIEARLVGQGTQGSSCPHLPALGITSACHMPGFLCVVPVPTITTEPQAAYLLSCLFSSPSYSQSSDPGPSLQRCLVTQGHSSLATSTVPVVTLVSLFMLLLVLFPLSWFPPGLWLRVRLVLPSTYRVCS